MDPEENVVVTIIAVEDKNVYGDLEDISESTIWTFRLKNDIITGAVTTSSVTEITTAQVAVIVNEEGVDNESNEAN